VCAVRPASAEIGEEVTITGVNLAAEASATNVYFGDIPAAAVRGASATSVRAVVPPRGVGATTVSVWLGAQASNPVDFQVSASEVAAAPVVAAIEPASGPVGAYITLTGTNFGSQVGTVRFLNATTGVEALGDVSFPQACSEQYWRPNSITVKVPSAYQDRTDVELLLHRLRVVRADGVESTQTDFTVEAGNPGPGICAVSPIAAGPGSVVELTGENFGSANGEVYFSSNERAALSTWTPTAVSVTVPLNARTGEGFLRSAAGDQSNAFLFDVESCNPDDVAACGAGYRCCASTNACMPVTSSCENVVPTTNYLFTFSTGVIPVVPRVLEQCQPTTTLNRVVSPTPWNGRVGGDAVCVNTLLSAQFNIPMDPLTLNRSTVQVVSCDGEDCSIDGAKEVDGSFAVGNQHVTFTPAEHLQPATTYQITISGALSAGGVGLEAPYVWRFTTSTDGALCDITGVSVMPDDVLLTAPGNRTVEADDAGDALVSASGTGDDACLLLNVDGTISWSVANNASSSAIEIAAVTAPASRLITALRETAEAVAARVVATITRTGVNGAASVTVDFTNPEVIEAWPNCTDACAGAEIGASFNTAMDSRSASTATVHVWRCANELCSGSLTPVLIQSPTMREENTELVVAPQSTLEANTYYRVALDATLTSSAGSGLSGLNYGNQYSWIFRTRADGAACVVDHVDMSPERATARAVGDTQSFQAVPVTAPDTCSAAGQRISASALGWGWASSQPQTATLLSSGALDRPLTPAPGCSARCVLTGSTWHPAVCGNGVLEVGEECDAGDILPGDGCSSTCLFEGTPACTDPLNPNCCGNSRVDSGEECDDGNTIDTDGCSAVCLNAGSAGVGATCGNGGAPAQTPELGGEDCDDGNTRAGDGCSPRCLNEGSIPGPVAVCGNGLVETGEECDDRNHVSGDGCSERCLFEGSTRTCGADVTTNCCGNGITETGNGETCDGGDGCSARCLLLGSSLDYSPFSLCGDGVLGAGESAQCDGPSANVGAGDGRVDAVQIAQISPQVSAQPLPDGGVYSSVISAAENVSRAQGEATFSVACSCEASAECPTSGNEYGCSAASHCCFQRPEAPSILPVGTNQCRNAQVRLVFGELMDHDSFVQATAGPQVGLRLMNTTAPNCPEGYTAAPAVTSDAAARRFVPRFLSALWRRIASSANALVPGGCYLPLSVDVQDMGDHSEAFLRYSQALEPSALYQVEVYGDPVVGDGNEQGVRSASGVALTAVGSPNGLATSASFTTGADVCDADIVTVEDTSASPGLFLREQEAHGFTATAYSQLPTGAVAIQPIANVYDWAVNWTVADTNTETEDPILTLDDATGETETVTSQQTSGKASVAAVLTVTAPVTPTPRVVSGSANAQVLLCEVPWPDNPATPNLFEAPLTDTEGNNDGVNEGNLWTNISTLYCRAEEAPTAGGFAPLPNFLLTQVPSSPNATVRKEWILRHPTLPEAIGIRVVENNDYLPVGAWFTAQGFAGAPKAMVVDGYRALQDGRTTYVGTSVRSGGEEQPVVVALSYSEGASPATLDVFNQLVANLRFHAAEEGNDVVSNAQVCRNADATLLLADGAAIPCTDDGACRAASGNALAWCDAQQEKIRRDLFRLEDLRTMEATMSAYGAAHKHCSVTNGLACYSDSQCPGDEVCKADVPLLDAGTYLRGWSVSPWPSWSAELGNAVGGALPTDPVNAFTACAEGADPTSCWNTTTALFSCPVGSHVYGYRRDGVFNYQLWTDTEAAGVAWSEPFEPLASNATIVVGGFQSGVSPATALQCTGALFGSSGVCGDGVVGDGEVCERGQTSTELCPTPGQIRVTTCNTTCTGFTADSDGIMPGNPGYSADSACLAFACGNGVVEGRCAGLSMNAGAACMTSADCPGGSCSFDVSSGAEQCDDGVNNGRYGFCSALCNYTDAMICGNGTVEGSESCDAGALNGTYGSGCSFDCANAGLRCGDAVRNGPEACDSEYETWAGALCVNLIDPAASTRAPCASQSECTAIGEVCGGTTESVACGPAQFCAGGFFNGILCSSDADCDHLSSDQDGVCTTYNTFRSRSCRAPAVVYACTWNPWGACQRQGVCGDSVVDPGETCDDGNTNNNDGCTASCRTNVCGDGFLNPNVEACDLGANNGVVCDPSYGGSCNYCSTSCTYQTVTGGYCGDGQVNGEEVCDGNPPRYLWDATTRTYGARCTDASNPACLVLGACNGGTLRGQACNPSVANDCGAGATCVAATCDASCGNSCPFNYQSTYAMAQPYYNDAPVPGSAFTNSVELYSYQTNGVCGGDVSNGDNVGAYCNEHSDCDSSLCIFESPDAAQVSLPACRVANRLTADITYNIEYPDVDIVFVLDQSGSMLNPISNEGRCTSGNAVCSTDADCGSFNGPCIPAASAWAVTQAALSQAVNTLYTEYPGTVRAGLVTYGRPSIDGPSEFDHAFGGVANYQPLWTGSSASSCDENYFVGAAASTTDHYAYTWPENWENIVSTSAAPGGLHAAGACMRLLPTDSRAQVQSAITTLPTPTTGNYTPMQAGLDRAHTILNQYPETHERIVVLLTDGAMSCRYMACQRPVNSNYNQVLVGNDGKPVDCSTTSQCRTSANTDDDNDVCESLPLNYENNINTGSIGCREVVTELLNEARSVKEDDIRLYTAIFSDDIATSSNTRRDVRTLNILSSDCEMPPSTDTSMTYLNWFGQDTVFPYGRTGTIPYDTTPANGYGSSWGLRYYGRLKGSGRSSRCTATPIYSYTSAGEESEVNAMMQSIIQNIVNARLTIGSDTMANTSSIRQGPAVTIPLPNSFACNPNAATPAQIHVDFGGTGTVTLSNMRFYHCPTN
jgi:cysteine-rich repeat protein